MSLTKPSKPTKTSSKLTKDDKKILKDRSGLDGALHKMSCSTAVRNAILKHGYSSAMALSKSTSSNIDTMFKTLAAKVHKVSKIEKTDGQPDKTITETKTGYDFDMGFVAEFKSLAFATRFLIEFQTLPDVRKIAEDLDPWHDWRMESLFEVDEAYDFPKLNNEIDGEDFLEAIRDKSANHRSSFGVPTSYILRPETDANISTKGAIYSNYDDEHQC